MRTLVLSAGSSADIESARPEAWVEIIDASGHRRTTVPPAGLRVGRAPDQDLVLEAPSVSNHHAELFWRGDDLFVQDCGSSNGTRRDGLRLCEPTLLDDGDEVVLGGAVVLRLSIRRARFGSPTSSLSGSELIDSELPAGNAAGRIDMLPIVTRLYQAASYEELGLQLARSVAELIGGSRIAVLELTHDGERFRVLTLHKASHLDPRPLRDAAFVSRSVLHKAAREGIAHFLASGREVSESITRAGGYSAAAAAIRPHDGIVRILYVDTTIDAPLLETSQAHTLELLAVHACGAFEALAARLREAHDRLRFEQLRRYFSPAVVEHIVTAQSDVVERPQNMRGTVLFADLVGYTALSERLRDNPEHLLGLLNRWLDAGAESVMAHGGTLDKFIGDCVMAVFGAPLEQPDPEIRAVHCALDMHAVIARIARETGEPLAITIGINSGNMLSGSVGSKRRLEYTVLGDTVNIAARLQSRAAPGEILLGSDTAAAVFGLVPLEDVGIYALRNHGPVHVFRITPGPRGPG